MMQSNCEWCSKLIVRAGFKKGKFCSRVCKGEFQRTTKPISKEQLYELYIEKELSCYQISKIVHRDPKRIYDYLIEFGIPIRKRSWDNFSTGLKHQDPDWLRTEYWDNKRSPRDMAEECGVTTANIQHFMRKNGIPFRNASEARALYTLDNFGEKNGMYGRKGELSPAWKGGVTPERQILYNSKEWKKVVYEVWKRGDGSCELCKVSSKSADMVIHHIVAFADCVELRIELSNLVLLCIDCHYFVHSNDNVDRVFIERR